MEFMKLGDLVDEDDEKPSTLVEKPQLNEEKNSKKEPCFSETEEEPENILGTACIFDEELKNEEITKALVEKYEKSYQEAYNNYMEYVNNLVLDGDTIENSVSEGTASVENLSNEIKNAQKLEEDIKQPVTRIANNSKEEPEFESEENVKELKAENQINEAEKTPVNKNGEKKRVRINIEQTPSEEYTKLRTTPIPRRKIGDNGLSQEDSNSPKRAKVEDGEYLTDDILNEFNRLSLVGDQGDDEKNTIEAGELSDFTANNETVVERIEEAAHEVTEVESKGEDLESKDMADGEDNSEAIQDNEDLRSDVEFVTPTESKTEKNMTANLSLEDSSSVRTDNKENIMSSTLINASASVGALSGYLSNMLEREALSFPSYLYPSSKATDNENKVCPEVSSTDDTNLSDEVEADEEIFEDTKEEEKVRTVQGCLTSYEQFLNSIRNRIQDLSLSIEPSKDVKKEISRNQILDDENEEECSASFSKASFFVPTEPEKEVNRRKSEIINRLLNSPITKEMSMGKSRHSLDVLTEEVRKVKEERFAQVQQIAERCYAKKERYDDTLEVINDQLVVIRNDCKTLHERLDNVEEICSDLESETIKSGIDQGSSVTGIPQHAEDNSSVLIEDITTNFTQDIETNNEVSREDHADSDVDSDIDYCTPPLILNEIFEEEEEEEEESVNESSQMKSTPDASTENYESLEGEFEHYAYDKSDPGLRDASFDLEWIKSSIFTLAGGSLEGEYSGACGDTNPRPYCLDPEIDKIHRDIDEDFHNDLCSVLIDAALEFRVAEAIEKYGDPGGDPSLDTDEKAELYTKELKALLPEEMRKMVDTENKYWKRFNGNIDDFRESLNLDENPRIKKLHQILQSRKTESDKEVYKVVLDLVLAYKKYLLNHEKPEARELAKKILIENGITDFLEESSSMEMDATRQDEPQINSQQQI